MRIPRAATHVIFDLDGVLLDTERCYTEATQAIVGRYGKTFDWSIKANMVGRVAMESARYLVQALDVPMSPEEFLSEREIILNRLVQTSRPMPGARELTSKLAERAVPQGIATSSNHRLYKLKTAHHSEWFRCFSTVIVGDDARLNRGKPAPDIFLLAAKELGADPSRCVVFEDSPAGVRAARAAGMLAIAVPDPEMGRTSLTDADLIVDSLADVTPRDLGIEA